MGNNGNERACGARIPDRQNSRNVTGYRCYRPGKYPDGRCGIHTKEKEPVPETGGDGIAEALASASRGSSVAVSVKVTARMEWGPDDPAPVFKRSRYDDKPTVWRAIRFSAEAHSTEKELGRAVVGGHGFFAKKDGTASLAVSMADKSWMRVKDLPGPVREALVEEWLEARDRHEAGEAP